VHEPRARGPRAPQRRTQRDARLPGTEASRPQPDRFRLPTSARPTNVLQQARRVADHQAAADAFLTPTHALSEGGRLRPASCAPQPATPPISGATKPHATTQRLARRPEHQSEDTKSTTFWASSRPEAKEPRAGAVTIAARVCGGRKVLSAATSRGYNRAFGAPRPSAEAVIEASVAIALSVRSRSVGSDRCRDPVWS
jgi:hypothetical protein